MHSKWKRIPLEVRSGWYSPRGLTGTLYIVSTPIGNLEDLSFRAVRILKSVALIACEDTRVTYKLLHHFDIETKSISYHAHSSGEKTQRLIDRLMEGEDLALVSDAGTPLVSDPGADLVCMAHENNIAVVPIPGASAVLSALVASGLPQHRWLFLGFLPRSKKAQREVFDSIRYLDATIVIYESPNRTEATLKNCLETLGDRPACVGRELTKKFETFERGLISFLLQELSFPLRGEVVLVIGPGEPEKTAYDEGAISETAKDLVACGESAADAAKALMHRYGLKRKAAYKIILEVKDAAKHT
jgi:16S rRNA (cytidine1402-2'-O)-methyltransferase